MLKLPPGFVHLHYRQQEDHRVGMIITRMCLQVRMGGPFQNMSSINAFSSENK